jgi:dihydrofolate synthase/folylpolyglutamate synthase
MADKDYGLYPEILGQYIDRVFTVRPNNPRALSSEELAAVFAKRNFPVQSFTNLADGVKAAYVYAKENDIPLIALGSLYMYREFSSALNELTDHI